MGVWLFDPDVLYLSGESVPMPLEKLCVVAAGWCAVPQML